MPEVIEEGGSLNSSTIWAKCKGLNLLVRNAETNFGRQRLSHHYVPVYAERMQTTYASKGPDVTLRNTWGHKNSDVSSMPRETERNLKTWDFGAIPSESRNWKYMQRIFKTHLRTTFWVGRPRRKFMKQAIASCMKFIKGLTIQCQRCYSYIETGSQVCPCGGKLNMSSEMLYCIRQNLKQLIADAYMAFQGIRQGGCTGPQLEMILRGGPTLRFLNSTQWLHRESEEEHASGNREVLIHTSDDYWKTNWWTKSWWERSRWTWKEVWGCSLKMVMEWELFVFPFLVVVFRTR